MPVWCPFLCKPNTPWKDWNYQTLMMFHYNDGGATESGKMLLGHQKLSPDGIQQQKNR